MKKTTLILSLILTCNLVFSQDSTSKELTLEKSVMAYYQGLYPSGVRGLKWIKGTDNYMQYKNKKYVISDAATGDSIAAWDLDFFKTTFPEMKNLPWISQINASEMVFNQKGKLIVFTYKGENKGKFYSIYTPKGAGNKEFNIKAKAIAYTLDNNLYLATAQDSMQVIYKNDDKNIVTGQAIHRYEFGISKGIFWSPEGSYVAFYQKDETDVADYPLLDMSVTPGKLKSIKYPMAGQKSHYAKVGIYDLQKKNHAFLKIEKGAKDHYLTNLTWGPSEKFIYLAEINRGQNAMDFNQYDVCKVELTKRIFSETSDKWIEPEFAGMFASKDAKSIIWMSEESGFQNLNTVNLRFGMWSKLTRFKFPITKILGMDDKGEFIFFQATGEDARESHVYKVNYKSGEYMKLTTVGGVHRASMSSTGNYIIDSYSNISTPKITQIINANTLKKTILKTSENPLKDYKLGQFSFVDLKSKHGEKLHARIIKPNDFDPTKKYPVLVYVYGGPHAQMVTNSWLGGASLWMHWMANQGYIIFTVDGRGSANRGFDFESQIHRQVGVVEMEDQLTGVEYLKSLNYVDSKRLAVHGWSYGGFMTSSLMLRHPGVFTTGVAGGPVIDWKWYEIMYGERYMDTPEENPEGYKTASVLSYVKNLEGKLLTIHGTVDDVVVMQHNLALLQKSVKEGIQMDFFAYPMHPHNVRGKDRVHLMTKILNYVIENNK